MNKRSKGEEQYNVRRIPRVYSEREEVKKWDSPLRLFDSPD